MTRPRDNSREERVAKLVEELAKHPGALGTTEPVPHYALAGLDANAKNRFFAILGLFSDHQWYIGRMDLQPETMWENGLKCRDHWMDFIGHVAHPSIESIIDDVNDCIKGAIAAAIGVGLLTDGAALAAASAAFKATLIGCLANKGITWANEINAWVEGEEKRGSWHWCA